MNRWVRIFLLVGLTLGISLPGSFGEEPYIHERGGMPNCPSKLKPGTWINTIFAGTSTTAGEGASRPGLGYPSRVMGHLRAAFPGASGGQPIIAGGIGSWWGAFCAVRGQAVYGQHFPGSILLVELAADDTDADQQRVCAAVEGIVRQLRTSYPATDLVFLYGLRKEHLDAYRAGKLPPVIEWHERVAEHYGVPSVNMGQYVASQIQAGKLTFDQFSKDGVHPTDRGHTLYAEAVKPLLLAAKAAYKPDQKAPAKRPLPAPLTAAPMVQARCVPYEAAKLEGDWQLGRESPTPTFRHVLVSDTPGATLSLRFKGAALGIFEAVGPDSGDVEVSVDGGDWRPAPQPLGQCPAAIQTSSRPLAEGLDPSRTHEVRVRVAAKQPTGSKGHCVRVGALLVDGEPEDTMAGMTPLERLDAQYAGMDQLQYTPPADRCRLLPRTMQRLREGGTLKIVLLGDSIMNQTSGSGFDLLLQRHYPKVKIERATSVRGSTGCWWYKDENRVEEYVLKHHPDLLMIGGISQRNDVDSIREVIRQVRAKQQPEILLLTPAFGFEGSDFIKNWTYAIDPKGTDYRAQLMRLASEEKCDFLDMTGPWWQYVKNSGKTYGWFRGDAVHANQRGTQILARILEKYFGP